MNDAAMETLRRQLVSAVRRACPPWLASRADDLVQTAVIRVVDLAGRDGGNAVPHPSPDDILRSGALYRALLACLGHLDRPRRAVVACHLQGYSVPEASEFLGWTKKKTEHLVRRGLTDLRSCLTEKGIEP